MVKRGKRYKAAAALIEEDLEYAPSEAISLVKSTGTGTFDQTVELHARTGADPRHSDQQVRGVTVLPHGVGKKVRVAVFTQGDGVSAAEQSGADFVGNDELVKRIEGGWTDFDVSIATPDMMGKIGRLGKILGRRGLMPNPKSGTVTQDIGKAVADVKKGKIDFKVEKSGIIHASVGKVSFDANKIAENANELLQTILKLRPSSTKGTYVKSVYMSSTMGLGIQVDASSLVE